MTCKGLSKFLVTALIAALLTSCGGIGFAYQKTLAGKYGLVAVDVLEDMSICEMLSNGSAVGVINGTVFAVGWDQNFVIAKQHPLDANHRIDKSVTNYYILRVSDGVVTGPLNEAAFDIQRGQNGVSPEMKFTLVFDNLK